MSWSRPFSPNAPNFPNREARHLKSVIRGGKVAGAKEKRRRTVEASTLKKALGLLILILDDGKLRDEHAQMAEKLGIWKPREEQ